MSTGSNGGTGGKVVPYTEADDAIVLARETDDHEMAEKLGRSVISIRQRRYKLQSTQKRKSQKVYTTDEVVQILTRVQRATSHVGLTPGQYRSVSDVIAMIVADIDRESNERTVRPSNTRAFNPGA